MLRGSRVSVSRHVSHTGLTPGSRWARRSSENTGFRQSRMNSSAPGKRNAVRSERSRLDSGPMHG